jgi:hypothetical protein
MVIDRTAPKAADPRETEPAAGRVAPPNSAATARPRATQVFVLLGKIAISAAVILYLSVKFDLAGALRTLGPSPAAKIIQVSLDHRVHNGTTARRLRRAASTLAARPRIRCRALRSRANSAPMRTAC